MNFNKYFHRIVVKPNIKATDVVKHNEPKDKPIREIKKINVKSGNIFESNKVSLVNSEASELTISIIWKKWN